MQNSKFKIQKLLTKKDPEKRLLLSFKNKAGRANTGRITVRHQGGGVKKLYRIVDFGQEKFEIPAKVIALEYDPFRTAFLMLLEYQDREKRYRIAPQEIKIGDEIICKEIAEIKPGNRIKLKNIPSGTFIYEVEFIPGRGGQMIRSAGSSAKVLIQEGKYTHLEMPSLEIRKVLSECFVTIGTVSNPKHKFKKIGKAGRSRLKGIRPTVRGSAMVLKGHPHGGGKAKAPIGLKYPKTPWGKPALGVKTRKRKWTNKFIVQRRKKKK